MSRSAVWRLALAALMVAAPAAHADLKSARTLLDAGRIEAAREAYEASLVDKNEADRREAMYQLALLSQSGHDYVRHLQQFMDTGGRNDKRAADVELRLGRFHYTAGDYQTALDFLESARDRRGDATIRVEARYWLGLTLVALRERDDARRTFEAVIGDRAGAIWKSRATYSLGEILRVSGDNAAAARIFASLRTDADVGAAAMLAEAQCRERIGDTREAAALYGDLLKLRPASSEAAVAREWMRARETIVEAAAVAPEAPPTGAASGTPGAPGSTGVPAGSSAPASGAAPGSGSGAASGSAPDVAGGIPPSGLATGQDHQPAAAGWRVQLGAFASIANARKLVVELEQRGYTGVMAERGAEPDSLYHVRFGRYADREAADQAGLDISAVLGLRYSLVAP